MMIRKAAAADFLCLFAGQADLVEGPTPGLWRDHAENLAAFLAAHEESLPDNAASFTTLLHIGGMLMLMAKPTLAPDGEAI